MEAKIMVERRRASGGRSGGGAVSGPPAQPALLVVDDERRCLEANLAACRLLGLSRAATIGRTVDDLLAPGMRSRLEHVWHAFQEGGGHAGPFELGSETAEAPEVHMIVTANVLPGRHLLVLSPDESPPVEPQAPGGLGWAPADAKGERVFRHEGPSAREREVLALLASGATDEQIAEALVLSPATVQTHVRNAKAKLGARTRAQAVALALQQGLIDLD